jgi:pteridine reductase
MEYSPNGKVALVTGAGARRVGNQVAQMLAARGYAIALHYHHSEADAEQTVGMLKEQGVGAQMFQANVARETDVDRMFGQIVEQFGRLDVLVTAAAVWESKPLEETTADDFRRQFEINALGTFLCCQKAGRIMVGQPTGGAIVTIGDWATARPYPGYAAYFPAKGAIPAMTRMFAVELSRRNRSVRVNCILPGPVLFLPEVSEAEREAAIADTLVGRPGRPEHVGHAVLFLVENDFVTGVCLPVDGGRTISGGEGKQTHFHTPK